VVSSSGASIKQTVEVVDHPGIARRSGVIETLNVLREWFPLAFAAGHPRPLKIGIAKDIAERAPAITDGERNRALNYHCKSDRYLRSMRPGAPRVDLDGVEVGAVTVEDAVHARTILDAKRAAKQPIATIAPPKVAEPAPPPAPPPPAPPPSPTIAASEAPPKTKQQRDLERAKADRERYRRSRLGVRA